jgi:4-hydroxy-3-polyprenylbenzoate decarboxylase/2,5-furandicarboxylate decarboxylase 1
MLKDMRSMLELFRAQGDLRSVTEPVSLVHGVAAGIRATSRVNGPALSFENVAGATMPIVGGLYASRRRLLSALGADQQTYFARFAKALAQPIAPVFATGPAPCQEVVLEGAAADLEWLPVCTYNEKDAGPFITMGIQLVESEVYGRNASISRMQIFDATTAGVRSVLPAHLRSYFTEAEAAGRSLPMAVAIGNDPFSTLASQIQTSIYTDELTFAGGLMGEPIELVKCVSIDVAVPATSEIVLEGEMVAGERRPEGPFGEYPGYYNPVRELPIFRLKAITHRRNPIFLAGLTGEPSTDNHVLRLAVSEAVVHRELKEKCPTLRDLCFTDASGGAHLVVSLRPTFAAQARDVMMAAVTAARVRPKLVIVVDEDIDPRDPTQVEWAVAYRVQADRDVVILDRLRGVPLDPSSPEPGVGAVMAIDATRPFGSAFPDTTRVPGADEFRVPGLG